jgi:hypothetical protein
MTTPNDQQCPECKSDDGLVFNDVTNGWLVCEACKGTGRKSVASEAVERWKDDLGNRCVLEEDYDAKVAECAELRADAADLMARNGELTAECAAKDARVAELTKMHREVCECVTEAVARGFRLSSELAATQQALRKYGRHDEECLIGERKNSYEISFHDCTCGFIAALVPPADGGEGTPRG